MKHMKLETKLTEALGAKDPILAANTLLEDEGVATSGATVVLIDDTGTYPAGTVGKVKGVSAKGSGHVDVELENGAVIPVMSSLLLVSR